MTISEVTTTTVAHADRFTFLEDVGQKYLPHTYDIIPCWLQVYNINPIERSATVAYTNSFTVLEDVGQKYFLVRFLHTKRHIP